MVTLKNDSIVHNHGQTIAKKYSRNSSKPLQLSFFPVFSVYLNWSRKTTEEAENFKFSASFLFPAFCAKGFAYKSISVLPPIPVNRHFLPNAPPANGETGGVPPCTKPAAMAAGFLCFAGSAFFTSRWQTNAAAVRTRGAASCAAAIHPS